MTIRPLPDYRYTSKNGVKNRNDSSCANSDGAAENLEHQNVRTTESREQKNRMLEQPNIRNSEKSIKAELFVHNP
jgi:hypothetical protein